LPTLEAKIENEKTQLANKRDDEVNKVQVKLEEDLAKLEEEGAKSDVKRKVRTAAESEMTKIRKRFDGEIAKRVAVFDRFRNLKVQDLEGDELLYRDMRDRYGRYFQGGMGA